MKVVSLVEMKTGQSGRVSQIHGGHGMVTRLHALGLHPGKTVTKISTVFQRGPVVLEIDHSQVALGYGRANRIFVEVED